MSALAGQCRLLCGLLLMLSSAAADDFISIGTGGVTGVYYPVGGAICRLINKQRSEHGIRCLVQASEGSVANLKSLARGELDFAVAQSDWLHHAYMGSGHFAAVGANKDLRVVLSLHAEPFTVVARVDSGIREFADLKGRRVNIGNPGSGQRATMERLMAELGWRHADFAEVHELKSADQSKALCAGEIDAMVFTVGHPAGAIKDATSHCDARLVAVAGEVIARWVAGNRNYFPATIPGGLYRRNPEPVSTFAVRAVLVAGGEARPEAAYHIARAVLTGFDAFRGLHPAFAPLERRDVSHNDSIVPTHRRADAYYRDTGLQ